ncbi:MAG TPA: biopolymer transporter ExbD [Bacteroidetes bacterium]|nr:biopolymer transporter ExbD [Ignavibacteria bacterium]HCA43546.1 biopolymer transporter ExbD [Bacteroidota bacterium]HCN37677.1 biopolymer transporter ExbD [Bacteroidota bacterium]
MAGGGFDSAESSGSDRGKKKYHKGKKLGVRIDMTPMVDVIMLLLTFFMLTTTLATPQVMQINLPKGEEKDRVKVDMGNVLFIRVSSQGNIYFSLGKSDGSEMLPERIPFENLRRTLESYFAANPNLLMLLKFDRKMKYNQMVDILDEINRAKIERKYSFLPMEEADIQIVTAAGG